MSASLKKIFFGLAVILILIAQTGIPVSSLAYGQVINYITDFAGGNAGIRISECVAALPDSGGTCDATALTGSQLITSDPFASTAKPFTLLLGNAVFVYSSQITIPSQAIIQGTGRGVTIFQEADGANLNVSLIASTANNNIQLKYFTLDLNSAHNSGFHQSFGIYLLRSTNAILDGIEVKNFYGLKDSTGVGIAIAEGNNVLVQNSRITQLGYLKEGEYDNMHQSDGIYSSGINNKIINNYLEAITDTAIVAENSVDPTITGNTIFNSVQGIAVGGGTATGVGIGGVISNNEINGLNRYNGQAILVYKLAAANSTQNVVVSNNNIHDSTDGAGIRIIESHNVDVHDNTLTNLGVFYDYYWTGDGIIVQNSHDINLTNNNVTGAGKIALWLNGASSFVVNNSKFINGGQFTAGSDGIKVDNGPAMAISSITRASNIVTVSMAANHTLKAGDVVVISGSSKASFSGTFTICGVESGCAAPSLTTFSYQQTAADDSSAGGNVNKVTSDGLITAVISNGARQGHGLNVMGSTTGIKISGNDFRGNSSDPGFINSSDGVITLGYNLTHQQLNSEENTYGGLINKILSVSQDSVKLASVDTGNIPASSVANINVAWPQNFVDAQYLPQCFILKNSTSSTVRVQKINAVAAGSLQVSVVNDGASGSNSATLQCVGIYNALFPIVTPTPTPTPTPSSTPSPTPTSTGGGGGGGGPTPTPAVTPTPTPTPTPTEKPHFDGYCLINNSGTFYLLKNSVRQGITNSGILKTFGYSFTDAINDSTYYKQFPEGNLLTPADGSLVKKLNDPSVYLISGQSKHGFTSANVFQGLGFKYSSILIITPPELDILPAGTDISNPSQPHMSGENIISKGAVYFIDNNVLRLYPSLSVYNSWNLHNDFSRVVPANTQDLNSPIGLPVIARTSCSG